jgi:hypothetical protein
MVYEGLLGLDDSEVSCPICLDDYGVGDALKVLPCRHGKNACYRMLTNYNLFFVYTPLFLSCFFLSISRKVHRPMAYNSTAAVPPVQARMWRQWGWGHVSWHHERNKQRLYRYKLWHS